MELLFHIHISASRLNCNEFQVGITVKLEILQKIESNYFDLYDIIYTGKSTSELFSVHVCIFAVSNVSFLLMLFSVSTWMIKKLSKIDHWFHAVWFYHYQVYPIKLLSNYRRCYIQVHGLCWIQEAAIGRNVKPVRLYLFRLGNILLLWNFLCSGKFKNSLYCAKHWF